MSEWTPQAIRMAKPDDEWKDEPDAFVKDDWAVHQTRWEDGRKAHDWSVTHVPTGRAATQYAASFEKATRLADELDALFPGQMPDLARHPELKNHVKQIIEAAMNEDLPVMVVEP